MADDVRVDFSGARRSAFACFTALLILTGCAGSSVVNRPASDTPITVEFAAEPTAAEPTAAEPDEGSIADRVRVLTEVDRWMGTRYRYGGTGKKGFDCSGFVYRVFVDALDVSLPRTTQSQMRVGRKVAADDLRFADLVFFYTPAKTDHVGVYLGNGEFAHASSSSGVMISHLGEDYWRRSYRQARRVVDVPIDESGSPLGPDVTLSNSSASPFEIVSNAQNTEKKRVGW